MRILFTGGGTGGHLFPIIAVAEKLKRACGQAESDLEMFFLGADSFSKESLTQEGIRVRVIFAGKVRRYFSLLNLWDLLIKLPLGFVQSLFYLFVWMPDVIFSKGGYGSVPVIVAAWLYWIPILVHESDTVPGLANRLTAKFAKRVAVAFASAAERLPARKTALVGNPVRENIIKICLSADPAEKGKARQIFGIASQKPVVLVFGGSQGAQKLNELVISVLPELLAEYEVIHQCGPKNEETINEVLGKNLPAGYHIYPFMGETQVAYSFLLADVIVSRAGAGNISEISVCGKPSILVPLPSAAADHQKENAMEYARSNAAIVLEEDNLTPHLLLSEIRKVLGNAALAQVMSQNAKSFSQPEAAQIIAEALLEMGT